VPISVTFPNNIYEDRAGESGIAVRNTELVVIDEFASVIAGPNADYAMLFQSVDNSSFTVSLVLNAYSSIISVGHGPIDSAISVGGGVTLYVNVEQNARIYSENGAFENFGTLNLRLDGKLYAGKNGIYSKGDSQIESSDSIIVGKTGSLTAEGNCIDFSESAGVKTILNSGTIRSLNEMAAISGSSVVDARMNITNTGLIFGYIFTESGDDKINSLEGRVVGRVDLSGGNDKYNGSDKSSDVVYGSTGADSIKGNGGNDILFGGLVFSRDSGIESSRDTLNGGAGSDRLTGDGGGDYLTGGVGRDLFDYNFVVDSRSTIAGRDVISDFNATSTDKIDLSDIDAIRGGVNNSFAFIGSAAFTAQGQVRAEVSGGDTYVFANVSGGTAPEMQIRLTGIHVLDSGDFVL
jgi:Ca2+-binding RTX toxin-like protein